MTEALQNVFYAFEQLYWVEQHIAAVVDDTADFFGFDGAVGKADGSLDAGQCEPFDSVAEEFEIVHLRLVEDAFDGFRIMVFGEQFAVNSMMVFEEVFVMPKRVVGIETDGSNGPFHGTRIRLSILGLSVQPVFARRERSSGFIPVFSRLQKCNESAAVL